MTQRYYSVCHMVGFGPRPSSCQLFPPSLTELCCTDWQRLQWEFLFCWWFSTQKTTQCSSEWNIYTIQKLTVDFLSHLHHMDIKLEPDESAGDFNFFGFFLSWRWQKYPQTKLYAWLQVIIILLKSLLHWPGCLVELKKQAQGWKKTNNCRVNTVTSGSRKKMVTSIMLNSLLTVVYSAAGDIMVVCQYFVWYAKYPD